MVALFPFFCTILLNLSLPKGTNSYVQVIKDYIFEQPFLKTCSQQGGAKRNIKYNFIYLFIYSFVPLYESGADFISLGHCLVSGSLMQICIFICSSIISVHLMWSQIVMVEH